jgi:hypothetical protein
MPDDRPPPVRLNSPPRTKFPKSKPPKRRRKGRDAREDTTLLYWIAGGLVVLLVLLGAIYYEAPEIKSWFAKRETPPENLLPLPQKPSLSAQQTEEEARLKKLKEKAAEEKRLLAEHPVAKPVPATAPTETEPPVVEPVPIGAIPGAPARALPVDMNKLDTERIAAYQVALERIHFSCGFIDGDQGMRTQRMLRAYQASHGLPVTGFLDEPTRDAIGEPGEPFLTYTVTDDDVNSIMPKPASWIAKSKVSRLGYNDIWELLAEKFHCTRAYLKSSPPRGFLRPPRSAFSSRKRASKRSMPTAGSSPSSPARLRRTKTSGRTDFSRSRWLIRIPTTRSTRRSSPTPRKPRASRTKWCCRRGRAIRSARPGSA